VFNKTYKSHDSEDSDEEEQEAALARIARPRKDEGRALNSDDLNDEEREEAALAEIEIERGEADAKGARRIVADIQEANQKFLSHPEPTSKGKRRSCNPNNGVPSASETTARAKATTSSITRESVSGPLLLFGQDGGWKMYAAGIRETRQAKADALIASASRPLPAGTFAQQTSSFLRPAPPRLLAHVRIRISIPASIMTAAPNTLRKSLRALPDPAEAISAPSPSSRRIRHDGPWKQKTILASGVTERQTKSIG
jgi:hypothetical protein